jgi:hypothetical protein
MPKRKPLPSVERLWELYDYKPLTGELVLRVKRGRPVAPTTKRLYRGVTVDGVGYQAHRVIWKWIHGSEPAEFLDHINRDKHDNRTWNLREVTSGENNSNKDHHDRRPWGKKGYHWNEASQRFKVRVQWKGKLAQKNCATEEEAQYWVQVLREQMWG